MNATTIRLSSAKTMKRKIEVPDDPDRLLRNDEGEYLDIDHQTLFSLWGSERILVYIPQILLQGLNANDVCYDLSQKLNAHFTLIYDDGKQIDTILVLPESIDVCLSIRVRFLPVIADSVIAGIQYFKNTLRPEIIEAADVFLSEIKGNILKSFSTNATEIFR